MTMNATEALDYVAQKRKKVIAILNKWISWVDCPNEKEIYTDMIDWAEQSKPRAYYEQNAKMTQNNIDSLDHSDATDEEEVFNFIGRLIQYHGGKA